MTPSRAKFALRWLRPSHAVMDLFGQGKRDQALQLYREQGASSEDISRLIGAASEASDRGISIEQALARVVRIEHERGTVGRSTSTSFVDLNDSGLLPFAFISGLCFLFAVMALVWDLVSNRTCAPGNTERWFCGGDWSVGEVTTILVAAALGAVSLVPLLLAGRTRD
jgi:hypothetical protein